MAYALQQHPDVDVTWLFSGRPGERLFDMERFGDFQHRTGLSFITEARRLRYRKTTIANRNWQFIRDVQRLDVKAYDLAVTNHEPVTARAGKLKGQLVLGIGHQHAFGKNTPVEERSRPACRNVYIRTCDARCGAALVQLWRQRPATDSRFATLAANRGPQPYPGPFAPSGSGCGHRVAQWILRTSLPAVREHTPQ